MGLKHCTYNKCLYYRELLEGWPPIYVGFYTDDFIYFSPSDKLERCFEEQIKKVIEVKFMVEVQWFLEMEYHWYHKDGKVAVHMSQMGYIDQLLD